MATEHRAHLQVQREKRIERTLPDPLGEQAIAATSYVWSEMTDISLRLALVQAALGMSVDGRTRATVTEVMDRAIEEAEKWIIPSVAGQVFSALGVRRVSVHGQSRLVLEFDQLKRLHEGLVERFERIKPRAEEAAQSFAHLRDQVQGLEDRVDRIRSLARREKELREFIIKYQRDDRSMADLERRYKHYESQDRRRGQLEKESKELSRRAKDLPSLEEKSRELQTRVERHEAEEEKADAQEKGIRNREKALGSRLHGLRRRLAVVDLAEMEEAAKTKTRELEERKKQLEQEAGERRKVLKDLDRQIKSRRSLLDRVLGREENQDAQ